MDADLRRDFLEYIGLQRKYSRLTLEAYEGDLADFADFLVERYGEGLPGATRNMVRDWVACLSSSGMAPRTIGTRLSAVRSFYNYALRLEKVNTNPAADVRPPRYSKKLPGFIEGAELNRLIDEILVPDGTYPSIRDRFIIELLFGTGMRRAEAVGLKIGDADMVGRQIKVLGKRNKERLIPMPAALINAFKNYLGARTAFMLQQGLDTGVPTVFLTNTGKPCTPALIHKAVTTGLRLISTQAKVSPHVLRHSYATAMLAGGADLNAIKELLGHESLGTTQIYMHTDISKLKEVVKQAHPRG